MSTWPRKLLMLDKWPMFSSTSCCNLLNCKNKKLCKIYYDLILNQLWNLSFVRSLLFISWHDFFVPSLGLRVGDVEIVLFLDECIDLGSFVFDICFCVIDAANQRLHLICKCLVNNAPPGSQRVQNNIFSKIFY